MKTRLLPVLAVTLALSFLAPAPQASARVAYVKVHAKGGRITAVSGTSISVQSSKTVQTYRISTATVIHLDGARVDSAELKKGMHAEVTASQLDTNAASMIEASRRR
jgi:hypothetical protein